jgi:CheY-like chemotaxis protein
MNPSCASILIVEDDKEIRESLKDVLEIEGYQVVTASNGQEAIETLRTMPQPCLILLDLMMPVMNGWEFLKYRRTFDALATIPVAIVTAAGEIKSQGLHAEAIIKKPIDLDVLLKWVGQFCSQQSAEKSA